MFGVGWLLEVKVHGPGTTSSNEVSSLVRSTGGQPRCLTASLEDSGTNAATLGLSATLFLSRRVIPFSAHTHRRSFQDR